MACCPPTTIPLDWDLDAAALALIGDEPATWPRVRTDVDGPLVIEAVHLELEGFNPAADSLVLCADPLRQITFAGSSRIVWSYRPSFATASPGWLVPGPAIAGGFRASCRLQVAMSAATNIRLWTDRAVATVVTGTVFYTQN